MKDHKRKMHHDPEMVPIPKRLHKSSPISMEEFGPGQEHDPEKPPRSIYEQERRAQELDREPRDRIDADQLRMDELVNRRALDRARTWKEQIRARLNQGLPQAQQQQQQPPPPQHRYESPDRVRLYVDHLEQKQAERERQIDMRDRERREITSSDPSSDETQKLPWRYPQKEAPQASSIYDPSYYGPPQLNPPLAPLLGYADGLGIPPQDRHDFPPINYKEVISDDGLSVTSPDTQQMWLNRPWPVEAATAAATAGVGPVDLTD